MKQAIYFLLNIILAYTEIGIGRPINETLYCLNWPGIILVDENACDIHCAGVSGAT